MSSFARDSGVVDVLRHRELLASLTWRDICARYRQSFLGVAWAVLLPLSMMLIFTFVFTRAVRAPEIGGAGMPYALYAFAGLVPWTLFSSSLSSCTNSLVANRNLVTKVYFPREVFPLSCVAGSLLDFAIAIVVLALLMAYFQLTGQWRLVPSAALLFAPVVLLVQLALTLGLGMLLAMGNLFYRDVRQLFSAGIQLLMFLSGVVVPVPRGGTFAAILALNPMVPLIDAYRDCILHGRLPATGGFAYASIASAAALILGWTCFRRASHRFAECI